MSSSSIEWFNVWKLGDIERNEGRALKTSGCKAQIPSVGWGRVSDSSESVVAFLTQHENELRRLVADAGGGALDFGLDLRIGIPEENPVCMQSEYLSVTLTRKASEPGLDIELSIYAR